MNIKDLLFRLYPDILWILGHPYNDFEIVDGVIVKWNAAKLGPQPTVEFLEARAKDLPPPPPPPPTIEERLAKLETDVSTLKGAKI